MKPIACFIVGLLSISMLAQSPVRFKQRVLYSNATGGGGATDFTNGMIMWFVGDDQTNSGSDITTLLDRSGNNYHTTGVTAVTKPKAWSSMVDGHKGVEMTNGPTPTALTLSNVLTPLVACNMFIVMRCQVTTPSSVQEVPWATGTSADPNSYFPYIDGNLTDQWGQSSTAPTKGVGGLDLTLWHVYEVALTNNAFTNFFDKTFFVSTNNAVVAFNSAATLGSGTRCRNYDFVELRLYTNILTAANRDLVYRGLTNTYPTATH